MALFDRIVEYWMRRELHKPLEFHFDVLQRLLARSRVSPSYGDCREICSRTRIIWQMLRTRFIDFEGRDEVEPSSAENGFYGEGRTTAEGSAAVLLKAEKLFRNAHTVLSKALENDQFFADQKTHILAMQNNIEDRISEMKIVLDREKTYLQKWTALIERQPRSFVSRT